MCRKKKPTRKNIAPILITLITVLFGTDLYGNESDTEGVRSSQEKWVFPRTTLVAKTSGVKIQTITIHRLGVFLRLIGRKESVLFPISAAFTTPLEKNFLTAVKEVAPTEATVPVGYNPSPLLVSQGALPSIELFPNQKDLVHIGRILSKDATCDKKEFVLATNQPAGPIYEELGRNPDGSAVTFDSQGKTFLYEGYAKGKWSVVASNVPGQPYDDVELPGDRNSEASNFNADGSFAYVAGKGTQEAIVVNTQEGKWYDEVSLPTFSPDGKKLAYRAFEKEKTFLVVNGQEGKKYPGQCWRHHREPPQFSPDGKNIAYLLEEEGKNRVVLNDKVDQPYERVEAMMFSPDSQMFVYLVHDQGKEFLVINGKKQPAYDRISRDEIAFSPDRKKLVYVAMTKAKSGDGTDYWKQIVANDKVSKRYRDVALCGFTSEGEIEYAAWVPEKGAGGLVPWSIVGEKVVSTHLHGWYCSFAKKKSLGKYSWVGEKVRSPDGKSYAFVARDNDFNNFLVVNGRETKLGRDEFGRDEEVFALTFSPNGKEIGYFSLVEEKLWWKVVKVPQS